MITSNFEKWVDLCPGLKGDKPLTQAFKRAFATYVPKPVEGKKVPTADEILVAAVSEQDGTVKDPNKIWTMETVFEILSAFGADVKLIDQLFEEKKLAQVAASVKVSEPEVAAKGDVVEEVLPVKDASTGMKFSVPAGDSSRPPTRSRIGRITRPSQANPDASVDAVETSDSTVEITEPKKNLWGSIVESVKKIFPKKVAKTSSLRPARSSGDGGDKKTKSGNASKFAFVALAVVILLIVGGVLWRLGNENGEYNSSDNSSASSLGLSTCTTADGKLGVVRYNITPNPDIVGFSGFTDPQRTLPYESSTLVFEQGKSYQAIIVGDNYRVGLGTDISVYVPISSFTQTGSECVQEVAVEVLTSGIESQQRASVQLAYKINFKHWSGLLVVLSLLSILGFTAITLFMSGGKIKDFVLMVVAVVGTAYFTGKSDWAPSDFFWFYTFIYVMTVALGSKSELQEQSDSFNAGNQLKLPQSMETLFKSLSRGWGIVGGYDWSQSAIYSALMMFVGAVYPSASPLVRALDSQIMAIGVGALFVVFSCAMEAWRRGLVGDWIAFALGFIGLLDFGIYYSAFGSNPPNLFDFSPSAIAVLGWTATFIVAVLANFGAQATSERTELQRDRMADGMLFFSAMKLVAILGYVFYFLM